MSLIYLDFNATTPIHPRVAQTMEPLLHGTFGNPSSAHEFGHQARLVLESARQQVAAAIKADAAEIVFTSGGTESNNLAIKGAAFAAREKGNHIVTSSIEHPAVSEVCRWLEGQGFRISWLSVDDQGVVDLEQVSKACTPDTILVSVMLANNELGSLQPIKRIAAIAHKHGALVHTDAAQAVGKIPVDTGDLDIDLLSIAGHKLYGPKGVGALFLKQGVRIRNILHGGDHEYGLRPGTENVLLAAGLGEACKISQEYLDDGIAQMASCRDRLEERLLERLGPDDVLFNGKEAERLPNTSSASFRGVDAGMVLAEIGHKVAVSAGAACHADAVEFSPVLEAIGLSEEWAMGTIRFSVGRETTEQEIEEAAQIVSDAVLRLKPGRMGVVAGKDEKIRLTRFTKGLGCACKLRPKHLRTILGSLASANDDKVIVDMSRSDDAAVYEMGDALLAVQTVDFLTPVVDDPYDFGQIAAANSLSDIYAMGAKPMFALNLVAFPSSRLRMEVLQDILRGAADKCAEAGVSIVGGHSIEDPEPKFGLVVTGSVAREHLWTNAQALPGDKLILTKPIGTGVLATGLKRQAVSKEDATAATAVMTRLNAEPVSSLEGLEVHACTDVTGFGLIGHLCELLAASGVDGELSSQAVPMLRGAVDLARANIVSSGTRANLEYFKSSVQFAETISESQKLLLADAQTSGGLLLAVPPELAQAALDRLYAAGVTEATAVATVTGAGQGLLTVTA